MRLFFVAIFYFVLPGHIHIFRLAPLTARQTETPCEQVVNNVQYNIGVEQNPEKMKLFRLATSSLPLGVRSGLLDRYATASVRKILRPRDLSIPLHIDHSCREMISQQPGYASHAWSLWLEDDNFVIPLCG